MKSFAAGSPNKVQPQTQMHKKLQNSDQLIKKKLRKKVAELK